MFGSIWTRLQCSRWRCSNTSCISLKRWFENPPYLVRGSRFWAVFGRWFENYFFKFWGTLSLFLVPQNVSNHPKSILFRSNLRRWFQKCDFWRELSKFCPKNAQNTWFFEVKSGISEQIKRISMRVSIFTNSKTPAVQENFIWNPKSRFFAMLWPFYEKPTPYIGSRETEN